MGKPNFSDDFKRDAVRQITERGYPERRVISTHSLYQWKKQYGLPAKNSEREQTDEICRLKRELPIFFPTRAPLQGQKEVSDQHRSVLREHAERPFGPLDLTQTGGNDREQVAR